MNSWTEFLSLRGHTPKSNDRGQTNFLTLVVNISLSATRFQRTCSVGQGMEIIWLEIGINPVEILVAPPGWRNIHVR